MFILTHFWVYFSRITGRFRILDHVSMNIWFFFCWFKKRPLILGQFFTILSRFCPILPNFVPIDPIHVVQKHQFVFICDALEWIKCIAFKINFFAISISYVSCQLKSELKILLESRFQTCARAAVASVIFCLATKKWTIELCSLVALVAIHLHTKYCEHTQIYIWFISLFRQYVCGESRPSHRKDPAHQGTKVAMSHNV